MSTPGLTRRITRAAALLAATGLAVGVAVVGVPSAGADPRQVTSTLRGVGSDTVQDVTNAFAGETNDVDFVPVHSTLATGRLQLTSWDAVPPAGSTVTCINPKGGTTFNRPNGSGQGRSALSRSIDGSPYGNATCGPAAGKVIAGLVDFSRSSSLSSVTGTDLTFIPFGRDGVSYAYYGTGGITPITDLTAGELKAIYTGSGSGTNITRGANTVHIIPCEIQAGSGTRSFFEGALGVTAAQDDTAAGNCNAAGTVGPVEENQPDKLKAKGDALAAGNQVIVAMSAASFIAQSNLAAPSHLAAGVTLGAISDDNTAGGGANLGVPFTGTAPTLSASSTFYASAKFGRNVYFVLESARVQTGTTGNAGLKQIFAGSGSLICQTAGQATVAKFGFLGLGAGCGDLSLQRGLEANSAAGV